MNKTNACLCHETPLASCCPGLGPCLGTVAGQGLSGTTLGRRKDGLGTLSGISREVRSSLNPEMGQARAASLADRMEMLLNLKVAGIGAPHLPDCAPRPLLKPGPPGTITYMGPPSLFTSSHQVPSVYSSQQF